MSAVVSFAFGPDRRVADAFDWEDARAHGAAVQMHRACSAQGFAAAEFGAGHTEHVAQYPKQGRVAVDIDLVIGVIDFDLKGHRDLRVD